MAHDIRFKVDSDIYHELQQLAREQDQGVQDFLHGIAVGIAYRRLAHRSWQTNREKVRRILLRSAAGRQILVALEKGQLQP